MSHDDISYTAIPLSTDSSISKSLPHPSNPEQRQVEWRISPWTPLATINLFIAGVLVCIGHHLFYTRLDGTPVRTLEDGSKYYTQTWIIRYGTAFAFLAKVLLAGSVVVAYKQRIWVDLRCRAHKIETIDAIFAATYDLTALMNPTLFLGAKLPLIMALIAW